MKVWWVLGWDQYYPNSRLGNVRSTHETAEEAAEEAARLKASRAFDYVEVDNISYLLGLSE